MDSFHSERSPQKPRIRIGITKGAMSAREGRYDRCETLSLQDYDPETVCAFMSKDDWKLTNVTCGDLASARNVTS